MRDRNTVCSLLSFTQLILDEADRMLDMGFERDIRAIVWKVFGDRLKQTFFYSATWPLDVQEVASDLLYNEIKVTVGKGGNRLTASTSVTQRVHVIDPLERMSKYVTLIKMYSSLLHSQYIYLLLNYVLTLLRIILYIFFLPFSFIFFYIFLKDFNN